MKLRLLSAVAAVSVMAAGAADALPPAPSAPPLLMALEPAPDAIEGMAAPESGAGIYSAFADEERQLRAALDTAPTPVDRSARARALAMFYASNGMCFEALDVLRGAEGAPENPEAALFAARCEIAVARYEAALHRLSAIETQEAALLRAIALSRIGAFREASEIFLSAASRKDCADVCALAAAAALLEVGAFDEAIAALAKADPVSAEAAFLRTLIAFRRSGERGARAGLEMLAKSGSPFAQHAQLALLQADLAAQDGGGEAAEEQLARLMMQRRGGAFEREALLLRAALAGDADYDTAFDSLRQVVDAYGRSDAAKQAARALEARLAALVDDRDVAPEEAARLFYENVEFAPPGESGDALIRALAGRLQSLDLLAEAAELLEHQTFHRLRGAARSALAADLARCYLDTKQPGEALRVIRATRYAGLAGDVVAQRLMLEAEALERLGRTEAALALLDGASSPEALRLKGEIAWRREDWAAAAAAYARYFDAAGGDDAAVRAAASYILAGDREAYDAFVAVSDAKVESAAARTLIRTLSMENTTADGFTNAYEAVFASGART